MPPKAGSAEAWKTAGGETTEKYQGLNVTIPNDKLNVHSFEERNPTLDLCILCDTYEKLQA